MAQYYYDKFNTVTNYIYYEGPWSSETGWTPLAFNDLYKNYSFYNGNYSVSNQIGYSVPLSIGDVAYRMSGSTLQRFTIYSQDQGNLSGALHNVTKAEKTTSTVTTVPSYNKGSLVQSNITAEEGTYPANGRHSDGYWYVKGTAVPIGPLPPGTVINQPYSTGGNGGRKLVRLANGVLVAVLMTNNKGVALYREEANGVWVQIAKDEGYTGGIQDVSITTVEVDAVGVLFAVNNNNVYFQKYKVSTGGVIDPKKTLDSSQTVLGNISLSVDPTNGHLHAAWASKNASYPSSLNIRYAKSTDGGVTWSAVEQVTNINQSDIQITRPTIVVRNSDALIIATNSWGASTKGIDVYSKVVGTSGIHGANGLWKNKTIYNGGTYDQLSPSAVVDKNGVIHVVWKSVTSNSSTTDKLGYSKSIDGGLTWTSMQDLTVKLGATANYLGLGLSPSLTVDGNNKLIVVFDANIYSQYGLYRLANTNGTWEQDAIKLLSTSGHKMYPSTLYNLSVKINDTPPTIYLAHNTSGLPVSVEYIGEYSTNSNPTINVVLPTNNQTLYENDTINISGEAYDADKDQSVTAYYQINSEQRKVLATNISQTQIALSKQLTFKGGKLYDGDTALTGTLADGVAHTLKVWAEDSEKASSAIIERTFYVVPNRAPLLSVDAVVPSGVVDADKFKISGTASDQDANSTVKVTRRINAGNAVEIYSGTGGAWEFELALSQLVVGQNTIVIEVVDNYGAKASKTVTLNKKEMKTPILQSVARYKIEPPKGSAKGVLLFIQRDEELDVKVELSMTLSGEQEQYETLTPVNTAPVQQGVVEDTFEHEGLEAKENIILKITPSQTDLSFNHKIHLISGAVD